METIPDSIDRINSTIYNHQNPLLLRTILRLNEHLNNYMELQKEVSPQELLQSTGVEKRELEGALHYLEQWSLISRPKGKIKNTSDGYLYVRESHSDIEFFGWTELNQEELITILEATQPDIKYNFEKTLEITEKSEAKLRDRAHKRIAQVWSEIEKDVRQTFGIEENARLPITYSLDIPNPMTLEKGYPSIREAVENRAALEGKFHFNIRPPFSFKGETYRIFPFGITVCTKNRKDGDYQVQNEQEVYSVYRLPVAVQQYGLEKIATFSQRMKQVHPEKIFPERAVPVSG